MTLSKPDNFDADNQPLHTRQQETTDRAGVPQSVGLPENELGLLETSVPLEAPIVRYAVVQDVVQGTASQDTALEAVPAVSAASPTAQSLSVAPVAAERPIQQASIEQPDIKQQNFERSSPSLTNEVVIPLLDERLVIDRQRRKVGEVVIRKEIETQVVEVPIHREKLIVEQVSPEYQQIAVVELGPVEVDNHKNYSFANADDSYATQSSTVSGEFNSPDEAIQFLTAIAAESHSGTRKVQVKVVLEDAALQATYQRWLAQHSTEPRFR
jgi:hypothetical protein